MADLKDFLLDESGDIQFKDGLLVFTEDATEQNQRLLLLSQPGDWKEHPTVGVGLKDFLLGDTSDVDDLQKRIQSQFEEDGMEIETLVINKDFTVEVEATYIADERR